MKWKAYTLILIILLVLLGVLYFNYISGWPEFRKENGTPKEFLSSVTIDKDIYKKDSLNIIYQLKDLLLKRKEFFQNTAYHDSTQLIIDSIVYNPGYNRLAVIIITKNSVNRQIVPDHNYEWHYDATCYLGERTSDTFILRWLGPSFTNAYSKQTISEDIRKACFVNFVVNDTSAANVYRYNLNDIRFWNSSIWEKYF